MNSKIEVNEGKFELSILGALLIMMVTFAIEAIGSLPLSILLEVKYVSSHEFLKLIVNLSVFIIPKVLIVLVILKMIKTDLEPNFKISYIKKFNFKLLLCVVFSMIGLYLCIQSSITPLLRNLPVPKFMEEGVKDLTSNAILAIISIAIFGPIFEEIILRGIILEGFLNKYKPAVSIIVSAILFGGMHMNLPQGINATMLGILFGYIYYKTRSLALSIVCHMVNNAIAIFRVNSSIITLLIGIAMLVTAIVFFEIFLKKMNHDDANLKKNIA